MTDQQDEDTYIGRLFKELGKIKDTKHYARLEKEVEKFRDSKQGEQLSKELDRLVEEGLVQGEKLQKWLEQIRKEEK
jgi:hypothetical protein